MTDDVNANVNDFDLEYKDVVQDPSTTKAVAEELAPQYKNKSLEDVINMHVNAEKVLRRQGQELGQLRRLTDMQSQLLTQQTINVSPRAPAEQPKREPVTAETLLSNPEQAITQAVAPAVAPINSRVAQLETQLARQEFEKRHPKWTQDVQNPDFQQWATANPTRANLLFKLDRYDFGAGNELWDLWNEHTEAANAAKAARGDKVRAATTVKSSSGEPVGKPVYSRAKLAELQMRALSGDQAAAARWNDPEFQREYMSAYAEDRVR